MKIMKKLGLLLVGFIAVGSFSACMKETEPYNAELQYEKDKQLIEAYNEQNFPNAIFHEVEEGFGIWYEVLELGVPGDYQYRFVGEGSSAYLEAPIVKVKYTGKLLNGTVFDSRETNEGLEMSLAGTIAAWRIMFLPRTIDGESIGGVLPNGLHPGARVRFVAPSIYGYANEARGTIPANSPLEFTIEVLDVRAPTNNN